MQTTVDILTVSLSGTTKVFLVNEVLILIC